MNLNVWPTDYDGRAIIGRSYEDDAAGMSLEENRRKYETAKESGDAPRMLLWAYATQICSSTDIGLTFYRGAGVGLVNKVLPAGDIVRETREAAKKRIQALAF